MALGTPLEQASFEELKHILAWIADANKNPDKTPGVLVGGWAVYAYNPYLGSIDIDLIVTGKMRKSLTWWLRESRGFEEWKTHERGWSGVRKKGPGDHPIIADFGSRDEEYRFEGRSDRLDFSELEGHTTTRSIDGPDVPVPERALLVLFKLKAAYDRGTRVLQNTSPDPEWDQSKRVKDLADVLALLDPAAGGDELGIMYLGEKLAAHPFLVPILREAGRSIDAIERYGRLKPAQARARVEDVISVTTAG